MARSRKKTPTINAPVYVNPNLEAPNPSQRADAKEAAKTALVRLKQMSCAPMEAWADLLNLEAGVESGVESGVDAGVEPGADAGVVADAVASAAKVGRHSKLVQALGTEVFVVPGAIHREEEPGGPSAEAEELVSEEPSADEPAATADQPAADESTLAGDQCAADESAAPEEPAEIERPTTTEKPKSRWKAPVAAVLSVALLAVAVYGIFVWDRWYRFNDERDIEGLWYVMGTSVPIEIGSGSIYFDDKTSYKYTVDPAAKTISFKLGNLDGTGHYWFRDDRKVLVIADGKGFTKEETANSDFLRLLNHFSDLSQGKIVPVPKGEGIIALSRDANDRAGEMIYKSKDDESSKQAPLPYDAVVDIKRD